MSEHKPYYVGVELIKSGNADNFEDAHFDDVVVKRFFRQGPAFKWLRGFKTVVLPDNRIQQRCVIRLPAGYRERKNIIELYKKPGENHHAARFRMLKEQAGRDQIFIWSPERRSGDAADSEDARLKPNGPWTPEAEREGVVEDKNTDDKDGNQKG